MKNALKLATVLFIPFIGLLAASLAADETVYGAGLTDAKSVTISELLAHPENYLDKKVRVDGQVADVCPHMGCWIDIEATEGKSSIRFKVKDGEIVFPMEAKGKPVAAEGVFTKIELDRDQAERYLRHLAEERGEEFDPTEVTGPITLYQIKGEGAVVR